MNPAHAGLWQAGLLTLALAAALAWFLAPLWPAALALQFASTPSAFGRIIHLWSAEDLARYRGHLVADFALLAAYGLFGYRLATRTRLFGGHLLRPLAAWLLPTAAVFDAGENVLHLWLTAAPRFGVPAVYAAAALGATLKWLLILGFTVLSALALLRAGLQR